MKLWFSIPHEAELQVREETELNFSTELFRIATTDRHIIPITELLGCTPEAIFTYTTVVIGDVVETSSLLAKKKSFLQTKTVKSPCDGIVSRIDHIKGELEITLQSSLKRTITSPYKGVVTDINNQLHIFAVDFPHGQAIDLKNANRDGGGKIIFLNDDYNVAQEDIKDCIIVTPSVSSIDISKFDTLGARGFMVAGGPVEGNILCAIIGSREAVKSLAKKDGEYIAISKKDCRAVVYS